MGRGALIVFEGLDRCGKSSQVKNILKELHDHKIPSEGMCFPDRSNCTGKVIDNYLKEPDQCLSDQAVHLLFTANRWESLEKLEELLKLGTTVIVDRYSYSGVAYSLAKEGSMDLEWCMGPERGLLKPDLVLYLDLDIKIILKRKGFGGERYEKEEFLRRVSEAYKRLIDDNWKIINAELSERELTKVLMKHILETIAEVKDEPLAKL